MTVHNNTENEAGPAAEAPEIPLPLSLDESTSPFVQEGVARKNLQEAKISYLDGSQQSFYVHKNADAEVLFNMVVAQLNLIEKDYFALSFFNELNIRLWLYKEKKIAKQLKGRPWEFELIVKFYPPEPDQLVEDFTRHLMVLQLRHDVYTERLPFVFEKLALLGSYVAQSELGDYQPHEQYDDYLRGAKIAPIITDELIRRVRDLHRDIQKGQTKSEAEFKYLEACAKGHHLYGVWRFDAKDSKGNPVQVGVSAHGIGIYNGDTGNPRLHMFAWQDIIKIAYRRNAFSIKLKEGVMDAKKEVNVNYRLADYPASKRLWKCGVEHHTFFRLVQAEPDIKPKHGLFRWGSSRFRYSGRTQLQTRMASNSYANSPGSTMQRTESGRVISKSVDDIAQKQHASPLRFADDPTQSKDLISSPEKSYPVSEIESDKKKKKKKDKRKAEDEQLAKAKKDKKEKKEKEKKKAKKDKKKAKKAKKGEDVSSTSSSSSDSASDAEVEKRFIVIPGQAGSSGDQVVPTGVLGRAKELHEIGEEEQEQQDVSTPHTTVHTWHETTSGPEEVTTEVDEHGNVITRTKKTQQVKHTIQKQSYQTFSVNDGQPGTQTVERSHQTITPIGVSPTRSPVLETHTRTIAYEAGDGQNGHNGTSPTNGHNGAPGEFVSSKTVTSGNRTIETITYKVEKDGVTETHVEHRVTIHSGDDIDHDAELTQAILEATQMNPHMTVEKIEVKQETTC